MSALGGVLGEVRGVGGSGEAGGQVAERVFRWAIWGRALVTSCNFSNGTLGGTGTGAGLILIARILVTGMARILRVRRAGNWVAHEAEAGAMEIEHTRAAAGTVGEMGFNCLISFQAALVRPLPAGTVPVMFDLSIG